ncbi:hypothetical protein [Lysinibacillus piscis]|uniref:Nucleoside 2-deoxyribosyltransferase n=1 Tax=Lysinibacillus piscis TaxID=2518931 RepID=A0ABQ5NML1_9BACI|nr:hypothetical protein [Lysinibacillus sp. KH24]GLC89347.1 hypothetical protein LYSBPC_24740 [Lysinibacillus sp. KH24]
MSEGNEKRCFIITPIGSTESEIRRATEGLIEAVIIPTLNELGFKSKNINVAHRISESGSINRQIITRIIEDDLNIVNLTGLNPNVMYELAVRHAIAKPVIMLAEEGTSLPFDIVDQRTIFYRNDMLGAVQLKEDLTNFVKAALNNEKVENPLIQLIQEQSALNNIQGIDKSATELILNRLDKIERQTLNNLGNNKKIMKGIESIQLEFEYKEGNTEEMIQYVMALVDDISPMISRIIGRPTSIGFDIIFNLPSPNRNSNLEILLNKIKEQVNQIDRLSLIDIKMIMD